MTRALVALLALGLAACSVNRKSSDLACTSTSDCHDGRHCDRGYCVQSNDSSGNTGCPSQCATCDPGKLTCEIDCDGGAPCDDVDCPVGFSCTIKCSGAQACRDVDCGIGGACDVTCTGDGACRDITCDGSCKCDVHCSTAAACRNQDCPIRAAACTRDEQPDAACDSSVDASCDLCQ